VYAYDKQSPNKTDIWGAVAPPLVKYKVRREGGGEGGREGGREDTCMLPLLLQLRKTRF
jgi:hypothetical protein